MAAWKTDQEKIGEAKSAAGRALEIIAAAEPLEDEAARRSRLLEAGALLSNAGRLVTGAAGPEQRAWGMGLQMPQRGH